MTTLRAGLIGLGMMGRHHGRVLAGLDGVELVAVADNASDNMEMQADNLEDMADNATGADAAAPTLIRENDKSPALYVLMPMRV